MQILIIGNGGREHAIAWALDKSSLVDRIFCTPGNAGTQEIAESPGIAVDDFIGLLKFARSEKIDLTIVGPEVPLVHGISDLFMSWNLPIFGPSTVAAMIEGSKIFAKELMTENGIPTAGFCRYHSKSEARSYAGQFPCVVKADGLAAGKGVFIVNSMDEFEIALFEIFDKKTFGASGKKIIIEEFLKGEEATILALCDGKYILPLIPSQDYKKIYDGNKGPNTGGMGAIAPAPIVDEKMMGKITDRILLPLMNGFQQRKIIYKGVIYAGIMICDGEPFVLEFNCRFGDPEIEAILPLLNSDFCELVSRTVEGYLRNYKIEWREMCACDIVLASGGYPGEYEIDKKIKGLSALEDIRNLEAFHSATKRKRVGGDIYTDGGRVLNIVGLYPELDGAIERAYDCVRFINFENMYYRKDIGSPYGYNI